MRSHLERWMQSLLLGKEIERLSWGTSGENGQSVRKHWRGWLAYVVEQD